MPHIVVKLWPGRSEELKKKLAERIVKDVVEVLACGEEWVSLDMEEVDPDEWPEAVYRPEIHGHWDRLYKKPGYNPLE